MDVEWLVLGQLTMLLSAGTRLGHYDVPSSGKAVGRLYGLLKAPYAGLDSSKEARGESERNAIKT